MGRVTGYTSPEGSVSYTYDANSNVLTVTDSHGTITRTYDALNRVSSYTDTYGKVIRYEYDAVGNLSKIIYPDNTAVTYAYDANHNLVRVTDWANRVTAYTYDANNRVVGVTKPDGSVTTTVYDNKQRVTSTVERTAAGAVITGFEYTYDDLSRIVEEKHLDNNTKMCYTYDSLNRVTVRTVKKLSDNSVVSTETFSYDAAGNVTDAPDSCFAYDTNNRLVVFNGNNVNYDLDGNMLNNGVKSFTYDSANRLITAGGHTYTYNAENVRIRNLCTGEDTTYTYDTNCRLSKLLCKTTNGVTTKYVYGRGLIGEEVGNAFKTYHFDFRGSTIAITDASGNITDTFAYDTYGKLISRTGTSKVIFGYNGRDGVVTDDNGLIYMRARYYSPAMRRFVNADIVPGKITNAVTLNRFAYANGNPVSFVDPFGLSVDSKSIDSAALFDILRKINSKRDTKFASEMLAAVLDQLLCFKNILTVGHTVSVEIPVGLNTTITYSSSVKSGSGNIEVGSVISDQLEMMGEFSFPMGDNGSVSVDKDGVISIEIEYSADIDKYTTISASISAKSDMSITAGYTITTNDGYNNIVSTSIELTHKVKKQDPPKPQKEPEKSQVTSDAPVINDATEKENQHSNSNSTYQPNNGYGWDDFGQDALEVAKGAVVVAGIGLGAYALANNATVIGFIDDFILLPLSALLMGVGA